MGAWGTNKGKLCALCTRPAKTRGWCQGHYRRWRLYGDPRAYDSVEDRFWRRVQRGPEDACWSWIAHRSNAGYGAFTRGGKKRIASRVAWELTRGPIPDGVLVCHRCANRACVNPNHLYLGTQASNMVDMILHGNSLAGTRNPKAKLDWAKVEEIRRLASRGSTQGELAARFGVHQGQISRLLRGLQWRQLDIPPTCQ